MFHPPTLDPLLSVAIVTASHPPSIAPRVIQKNKERHQRLSSVIHICCIALTNKTGWILESQRAICCPTFQSTHLTSITKQLLFTKEDTRIWIH